LMTTSFTRAQGPRHPAVRSMPRNGPALPDATGQPSRSNAFHDRRRAALRTISSGDMSDRHGAHRM
jgi:hypothetical protein